VTVQAVWLVSGLTLRRMIRGRALWVGLPIALLPALFAPVIARHGEHDVRVVLFVFELLVTTILSAMWVASSIGEDIEERTATYLWSRPVPRWSLPVGKLIPLVPIVIAFVVGGSVLAHLTGGGYVPTPESLAALAGAAIALSSLAGAMAVLVPKHALPLTLCYALFFDGPITAIPAQINQLSVAHQATALAGFGWDGTSATAAIISLALLTVVWGAIAVIRIGRVET
jgi:hypothetical protein